MKKNVISSFEKRYEREADKICFVGMNIDIFKSRTMSLSCAVSVGGWFAAAFREDECFVAEFDRNQKQIRCNINELKYHIKEPIFNRLYEIEKKGINLLGADCLFRYNTELFCDNETVLTSGIGCISKGGITKEYALNCLNDGFSASFAGRENSLLFRRGDEIGYIPFANNRYKIIIAVIKDKCAPTVFGDNMAEQAIKALEKSDFENFGRILNEGTRNIQSGKKSKTLFDIAVRQGNALGCGIFERGGIFAIAENKRTDTFIRELKEEYENFHGRSPDFYITQTENSGIYG